MIDPNYTPENSFSRMQTWKTYVSMTVESLPWLQKATI